jgi:hypothetical protein
MTVSRLCSIKKVPSRMAYSLTRTLSWIRANLTTMSLLRMSPLRGCKGIKKITTFWYWVWDTNRINLDTNRINLDTNRINLDYKVVA